MPSKFTAYLHFSQEEMNRLAKLEPSILENDGNISKVIRTIFDNIINGKYMSKEKQDELAELQKEKLKVTIEKYKEETTNLKIKNKIALIHDLKISPATAHDAIEKKIPIEQIIGGTNEPPITSVNAGLSPYDEINKRLECIDCGILFPIESIKELYHLQDSQMKYLEHIAEKHQRPITNIEKEAFKKLGVPI